MTANNGGILGSISTPGIIDTADLNLQAGSTFDEPINGPTPGIGYSQVVSSGPVMLTGSTLNVTLGYTPAFGASYDILQNTSGSPVIGTFNDLPEGASITVRSYKFFITYHGGTSGDDVVLNTVQPSPTTITSVSGIDSLPHSTLSPEGLTGCTSMAALLKMRRETSLEPPGREGPMTMAPCSNCPPARTARPRSSQPSAPRMGSGLLVHW